MAAKKQELTPEQAKAAQVEEAKRRLLLLNRQMRLKQARERMMDFTCLTMPDPANPDDPDASRYKPVKHHHALAEALEAVVAGKIPKLIVSLPPRHGKSELVVRRLVPFVHGREPSWEIIQASYNDILAQDFGRDVRDILRSKAYQQIFPGVTLKKGSQAADRLEVQYSDGITAGGSVFVGRGGSLTGRGADLLIADDLFKGRAEAQSTAYRDQVWSWFLDDFLSRAKDEDCRVIICMTRWHEDDVIGRLTDPRNPHYDREEAASWHILELPALAFENDPLGRAPGEPLWPEKFGREWLLNKKRTNQKGFASLYQGRPTPEEGAFFRTDDLVEYDREELPPMDRLRIYAASDHAVSLKQDADRTCLGIAGLDEEDTLWVLPDVVWRRMPTDQTVEQMLELMRRFSPLFWWAENEHIGKSIGPFLFKRMQEERVYCTVEPITPSKDKMTRAQAIKGRASMRKVRFPRFAPWWPDAKDELLKFPGGAHDDFVDMLSNIGARLPRLVRAQRFRYSPKNEPPTGTIQWIKAAAALEAKKRELTAAVEGW